MPCPLLISNFFRCRISASSSRSSSRSPTRSTTTRVSSKARSPPPPPPAPKEPEPEMDLEIGQAEKPIEETLAERRARRQAIRAKYTGIASTALSINGNAASPSPGLSSAVLQPPPTPSNSDLVPQNLRIDSIPDPTTAGSTADISASLLAIVCSC